MQLEIPATDETELAPGAGVGGERGLRARRSPDARAAAIEQRRLEQELRQAVAHEALSLYYQPLLALGSGELAGAEALIRWPHRRRGLVSPCSFIPLAERSGLMAEIGGWALREACREAARWPAAGGPAPVSVAVNVAERQLHEAALLSQIAEALDVSGLAPERLTLELTEKMLVDVDIEMLLIFSAIRDLGVGLALDDFGTGFASLAMLKRLPLTEMKLDRSLLRALPEDREDAAIVRAVVETGHAFGLSVVAEGIETEPQRAYLAGIGCDYGQGYLFSQPLPASRWMERLRA